MVAAPALHLRPPALRVHVGPRARARVLAHGLQRSDVRVVPGAAGGPKGLVLNPLDRFLFGQWLRPSGMALPPVHLLGASIGAWRMACACLPDPDAALDRLAQDYVAQRYDSEPGRMPDAGLVTRVFGDKLAEHFEGAQAAMLSQSRFRLHVVVTRGRAWLSGVRRPEDRAAMALGFAGAYAANALGRRHQGRFFERVVLSDPREALPFALSDYRSRVCPLTVNNLLPGILASCSIPFWLTPQFNLPGAPSGAYWDGGLSDYHLHWPYADMPEGDLVLYPHFQATLVPGWLDKAWRRRHRATPMLDNLVLLSPNPEWVASLPGGKLPDRTDFKTYGDRVDERAQAWRRAIQESQALADEFEQWAGGGAAPTLHALV